MIRPGRLYLLPLNIVATVKTVVQDIIASCMVAAAETPARLLLWPRTPKQGALLFLKIVVMNIIKDEKNQRVIGQMTEQQAAILLKMAEPGYLSSALEYFLKLVCFSEGRDECLCKYIACVSGVYDDLLAVLRQADKCELKDPVEISVSMEEFNKF